MLFTCKVICCLHAKLQTKAFVDPENFHLLKSQIFPIFLLKMAKINGEKLHVH